MTTAGLVVVGGGPIGLACAIEARLAGMEVVVVEPRDDPIDKACGEGLMPGALAALHRIGVDPPGHRLDGIAYLDGSRRVEHRFAERPGRGVRRTVLHRELARRAAELGTPVLRGRVSGLSQRSDGVELSLAGGETIDTPWVIAADGLHSPSGGCSGWTAAPSTPSAGATGCDGTTGSRPGRIWWKCTGLPSWRPT